MRSLVKDFIKSVEQKAYERGYEWGVADEERRALEEDVLKDLPIVLHKVEQIKQQATLTERKRVNDILDGMKKEGDDFQCFNTDCFGNRTPTVIEKRLSSQDESYNLALEQAKHLINNTQ